MGPSEVENEGNCWESWHSSEMMNREVLVEL